jgi:hypothetical protein
VTERSIGTQLDDLGLTADVEEGHRVLEATVTLVTGDDSESWHHQPIKVPSAPGVIPVPHPLERRIVTVVAEGQQVSIEQRQRIVTWLKANGIEPRRVADGAITVEYRMRGDRSGPGVIGFREYYESPQGHRTINERTLDGTLTYERWVRETTPLEPDPAWEGWEAMAAHRAVGDGA